MSAQKQDSTLFHIVRYTSTFSVLWWSCLKSWQLFNLTKKFPYVRNQSLAQPGPESMELYIHLTIHLHSMEHMYKDNLYLYFGDMNIPKFNF